jgi:hypothetical protein
MLNPTSLLADALGRNLAETYRRIFGDREPHIAPSLDEAARLIIERIGSSDALYHDCQHTALVTLCVQDILRGRRLERVVTPNDWSHTIMAALTHDIGYVRGVCAGDTAEHVVIDDAGNTVTPPRGASDAFLTPYHVDRGKIVIRERFASVPFVDEERIARAIELTRFPVPEDEDHAATDTEAGLVRAGDLIRPIGRSALPAQAQRALLRIRRNRRSREARLPQSRRSGRPLSGILLEQGRALYQPRDALPRDDDGGKTMDRDPLQPHFRDRA